MTERQKRKMQRNAEIYSYYVDLKAHNPLATRHTLVSETEKYFREKYNVCVSTIYHIVEDFEKTE